MKVILLKDVAKIGRRFDVVTVQDGYALNKLIPKNLAQAATPENLKRLQNMSQKVEKDRESQAAAFATILEKCADTQVEIKAGANAEGRLFQALKASEIAEAIKDQTGCEVGAEHLVLKTPIKSVGEHEISLHSGDQHGMLTVVVAAK